MPPPACQRFKFRYKVAELVIPCPPLHCWERSPHFALKLRTKLFRASEGQTGLNGFEALGCDGMGWDGC